MIPFYVAYMLHRSFKIANPPKEPELRVFYMDFATAEHQIEDTVAIADKFFGEGKQIILLSFYLKYNILQKMHR